MNRVAPGRRRVNIGMHKKDNISDIKKMHAAYFKSLAATKQTQLAASVMTTPIA